jgi:Uma2 family endonuclease
MSTATLAETAPELFNEDDPLPMETDEALYELVNGKRVEMPAMSFHATMIVSELGSELNSFAKLNRLGKAFVDLLVRLPLAQDVKRNRRPDVSFFSSSQLAIGFFQDPKENALEIVPELAVEVTSPTDRAEDQRNKVHEYFQAGVRYVWVVYPELQIVDVYESPKSVRVFGPDDTLVGDPILPGFQLRLADLFTPFAPPQ